MSGKFKFFDIMNMNYTRNKNAELEKIGIEHMIEKTEKKKNIFNNNKVLKEKMAAVIEAKKPSENRRIALGRRMERFKATKMNPNLSVHDYRGAVRFLSIVLKFGVVDICICSGRTKKFVRKIVTVTSKTIICP